MISRAVADAARRLADQRTDRFADIPDSKHVRATVVAVTPREGSTPTVTVRWRGSEIVVSDYGAHYTPAVGHRVLCAYFDNQLTILHHSVGQQ